MDELIRDFLTETTEGLDILDQELVRLEKDPNDKEILGNIFRVMHTIKGTCGFLALPRLESVAHAGENILGKVRDGKLIVNPVIISSILEAIDCIKAIIEHIDANEKEPEGDDNVLIAKLNQCAEGEMTEGSAAPAHAPIPTETPAADATATLPLAPSDPSAVPVASGQEEAVVSQQEPPPAPATSQTEVAVPEFHRPAAPEVTQEAIAEGLKTKIKEPVAQAAKNPASNQTIRVSLDVLENLMQMVSELVLTRNQLLQLLRTTNNSAFASPLQRLNHITSELQERVMKTRMQPVSNAWTPFPRLVRDLSLELGKKIELQQVGGDTELDRQLLELIKDPLTHMVRNSCDHGLEPPEERKASGKGETGTVTLRAYHEGGHIIIEISDDGRGIPVDKIRAKILSKSLASETELAGMNEQQILQFIFKPGFSTAEKVTSVSGRGVGMDVVKTNIERISGTVELSSTVKKGSTFKIKIPLTLAIMPVLIVEASKHRFAIPQANVVEMVRTGHNSEYKIENINNSPLLRLRGKLLPLISLSHTLKLTESEELKDTIYIIVCEVGRFNYGIIVDKVFDTEEIVVKPAAPVLQHIEIYSGTTILGDGNVIMILDPNGLARTTGEMPVQAKDDTNSLLNAEEYEQRTRFLIFSTGPGTPKAVPLELVTRLEEIDTSTIEQTSNGPVIQYRDALMFLTQVDDTIALPTNGIKPSIVFTDHDKTMGLIVEEILDIVEHHVKATSQSSQNGFLGSIVIDDKTCDLVDVGYYFKAKFPDMSEQPATSEHNTLPRLLFVDDSPFFRKFIPPALIAAGYQVTTAEDAEMAIEILQKDKFFSAIITDMNMPGMNGAELAKYCKNDNNTAHIPVVALSSQSSEQIDTYADREALSGYVSKTNHNELLATIADLLSHKMAGVA